ncbi:hypothetical protein Tco_0603894 [Tanacetum coccineum]
MANTSFKTQISSPLHNDMISSCVVSKVQEKAQLSKAGCMKGLKALQSHFTSLLENLKDNAQVSTFKRTFSQDMDLLEKQLTKEILHKIDCKTSLTELRTMFDNTFNSDLRPHLQNYTAFETIFVKDTIIGDMDFIKNQMTDKYFFEYTGIEYDRRVNKRQMQTQESKINKGKALDADLVVTESSGTESEVQDESSMSGNDIDTDDADIRHIYDEEPMAEVQLTAECNIFAIGQQHTEQEIINEGRVDQYTKQCQVKSPMLDSSPDNQTTEYSKQSPESENILLKKIFA